ncbi:MAG: hypothetical protein GYA52_12420 [Chloroflexi bacterium]|nr:hypothetical protein [Chloroflexota bacterium]
MHSFIVKIQGMITSPVITTKGNELFYHYNERVDKLMVIQFLGAFGDKNKENSGYIFNNSTLGRSLCSDGQYKGNIDSIHHFIRDGMIVDADNYIAIKK